MTAIDLSYPHWLATAWRWLGRLILPAGRAPATESTPPAPPAAEASLALGVGRRFPIAPERAPLFYRAADESW